MPNCQTISTSSVDAMDPDDLCHLKRSFCTGPVDDLDEGSRNRLVRLLGSGQWKQSIDSILHFAGTGRIAKRKPLIAALAFSTSHSTGDSKVDTQIRQAVYRSLSDVFRTPSDLFQLLHYEGQFSKNKRIHIGRCKRSAIAKWYNQKSPMDLAYLVTKYKKRCGWSHRDVLRVAHVRPGNDGVAAILKYVTKDLGAAKDFMLEGGETRGRELECVLKYLEAVETVKSSKDEQQVARLVEEYKLMHEHVPTWLMKSKEVWRALLPHMPMLALVKNLNRLGGLGLLNSTSEDSSVQLVVDRLLNEQHLREACIHPLNVFLAWKTYEKGKQSKNTEPWKPKKDVCDALETAFYKSFAVVESTNKRYLLAIDASATMSHGNVLGCSHVSPLAASAAMAMILARKELSPQIVALSGDSITPLSVTSTSLHHEICRQFTSSTSALANCSRPMLWAAETRTAVDVFVIYTDQRGGGTGGPDAITPVQALRRYRETMNLPRTRLVIVTLTCNETDLADSVDSHVIHLAGFDSATPEIIRSFVCGELDSVPAG